MATIVPILIGDQQPLMRVVGKRRDRQGLPPSPEAIAAQAAMARYVTRAPKGVFRYNSHEEMDADRLRWQVEAMQAVAESR